VNIDAVARVVINERTGTVVMGGDVHIGAAAVAHGNLSVRISTNSTCRSRRPSAKQHHRRAQDAPRRDGGDKS
jgi:flagellar P-ring protein precursor FlgI